MESVRLGNEGNPGPELDYSSDDTGICKEVPVDRISDLQEDIICHIFSFLPAESVAATRFLSKSWRFHWTKVTSFNFDDEWWLARGISYYERPGGGGMSFVEFVNMFLLHQNGEASMKSFRLAVNDYEFPFIYLDIWVNTAIARNIRVLDLCMVPDTDNDYPGEYGVVHDDYRDYEIYPPVSLYTCGTLEVLKLCGPFFLYVRRVVYLPKLTLLQLHSVKYESNEAFCQLISGSPVLESLIIYRCHDDDMLVFSISSPVVKSLKYFHHFIMCEVCRDIFATDFTLQIDTPALEYLSLFDSLSKEIIVVQELASLNEVEAIGVFSAPKLAVDLLQAFNHVKILDLSGGIMDNLMDVNKKLSVSFQRLTKLVISIWPSQLNCLIDLINCCPTLEVLHISTLFDIDLAESEFGRDPIIVPKCFSYSLRHVSFRGAEVFEDGYLTMFKFIVNNALVLKKFGVHATSSVDLCKKFRSLEKVLLHCRLSPTCNISFSSASFEMDSMDV